jgi:hypothetical protein
MIVLMCLEVGGTESSSEFQVEEGTDLEGDYLYVYNHVLL